MLATDTFSSLYANPCMMSSFIRVNFWLAVLICSGGKGRESMKSRISRMSCDCRRTVLESTSLRRVKFLTRSAGNASIASAKSFNAA